MSYYKVRSVNMKDKNNIMVTLASSNVTPISYMAVKYTGNIEELFQNLLSGELQINSGNRQLVHEAYLTALVYLKEKGVSVVDLWYKKYECDNYKKALEIFMNALDSGKTKGNYFIQIDGREFYSWAKHGYKYSSGRQKTKKDYIDVLLAQMRYENVNYEIAEN